MRITFICIFFSPAFVFLSSLSVPSWQSALYLLASSTPSGLATRKSALSLPVRPCSHRVIIGLRLVEVAFLAVYCLLHVIYRVCIASLPLQVVSCTLGLFLYKFCTFSFLHTKFLQHLHQSFPAYSGSVLGHFPVVSRVRLHLSLRVRFYVPTDVG